MVVPQQQQQQVAQQQSHRPLAVGNGNSTVVAGDTSQRKLVVRIERFHGVAKWSWNANDEVCGICQAAFEGAAPGIR